MTLSLRTAILAALTMCASIPAIETAPQGWASYGGTVTGGGSATPVVVTTLADLQSQVSGTAAKVIYVSGTMGAGVGTRIAIGSNKTVFGLPGATINGGFDINGSTNVIVRNLTIKGPGAVDVDGVDCMTIQNSTRIWIDHNTFQDGQDGNLDVVNGSNYVTLSWNRFRYTSASTIHMFSNLFGNSDSKTTDRGKLKITVYANWWDNGVQERMPRVRFGQVHVVNNLFSSTTSSNCVRAGIEADIMVEANVFNNVTKAIDLYEGNYTGVTSKNNLFSGKSTNIAASTKASFTPPYTMTVWAASEVQAKVSAADGAGPTLCDPRQANCTTPSSSSVAPSSSSIVVSSSSVTPSSSSIVVSSSSVTPSSSSIVVSSSSVVVSSSSAAGTTCESTGGTLDLCGRCTGGTTGLTACTGLVQGEDFCSADGVAETKNTGFLGASYLNFDNATGSAAVYAINASQPTSGTFYLRYSNGSGAVRNSSVSLNGSIAAASLSFPATADFTTWNVVSTPLNLVAGVNLLTLTSLGVEGGPNLDLIGFSSANFTKATSCTGTTGTTVIGPAIQRVDASFQAGQLRFSGLDLATNTEVRVISTNGKIALQRHLNSQTLDASQLEKGMYLIQIRRNGHTQATLRATNF